MDVTASVDSRSSLKVDEANDGLSGTCQVKISGRRNDVVIDGQAAIGGLSVTVFGNNNVIHVAENNNLGKVQLFIRGHNSRITIGSNNNLRSFNASIGEGHSSISIGNECLFSIGIEIRTHDSHKIFDLASNERFNLPESVVISDRVWIGQDVLVLKGSQIGTDSVIGVRSVVTSAIPPNSVAVGVPARVVRNGVRWSK